MRLEANGNGTTGINVELNEDGRTGTNIRLSSGERLEAEAGGVVVVLNEDFDFLDVDYEGSIPTDASNTQFTITWYRADGSILNGSRATLPDQFSVPSPRDGQTYLFGNVINVTWVGGTGGVMLLETTTTCQTITGSASVIESLSVPDNGSFPLNTANLDGPSRNDVDRSQPCDLSLNLRRENDGSLDTRFRGGGFVRAVQQRRIDNMRIAF